jgi:hypothetical protein
MLQFFCPTAQKDFDSGIIVDRDTYNRERLTIVETRCPHCARAHRYLMADAVYRAEAA